MDIMLHNHNAKPVCDIPDGLRELCADISREVVRSQPNDIYWFIADYLDTLMITRENAKVAMKVVQNIMLKSEQIVEILSGTGIKLEEIAAAAPRLQKAFRVYLKAVDEQKEECGCDDSDVDDESEISICRILKETGASYEEAQCAAIKIQALFRGHYERMSLAEKRGEVQWQRAAANTMEILRKSGVTQIEASNAAIIIQSAYRGYYTRKNLILRKNIEEKEGYTDLNEQVDITAWLDMMFENTGLTIEHANKAAIIIQNAYRRYRTGEYPSNKLVISSKISGAHEREKFGSLNEVASASKESDRRRDESSQITSTDDDSEIDSKSVTFQSTANSDDDAQTPIPNIKNTDGSVKSKEEDKDDIPASDAAEEIHFTDIEEHNENNDDKQEDEQIKN